MTDNETTAEQLAEIQGQAESTPATEYTPPEGWRVLKHGEVLQGGDEWVNWEGTLSRPDILHGDGTTASGGRYIRRIKQEPQPEPQPEAQPVQVREGRWRTRAGEEIPVTAMPTDHDDFSAAYQWWDGDVKTWANNGAFYKDGTAAEDLVEYLGPIEQQPKPVRDADERIRELKKCNSRQAEQIEELRSEVYYVQNLLGESRQRVRQLEELVSSLRIINDTQEKAFSAEGKENTALRNQLAAVKAELASVAADRQQLRIELDAAQQVPPAIADRFHEGWNQGTARAIERVLEWLEPVRLVDSAYLANATMQHLPQIMRTLTGLDSHAID